MTEYIKQHEEYILSLLQEGNIDIEKLLKYHRQQISWLQHERLIHLLVMCLTIIAFLFSCFVLYFIQTIPAGALFILLLVLTAFYIRHYYLLENSVQHWYKIANYLNKKSADIGTNTADLSAQNQTSNFDENL